MNRETYPIELNALEPLKLNPGVALLSDAQRTLLKHNIQLCRDTIVFFTALAGAKGLSGHTGGAYDTVPEVMILRAFIANGTPIVPIFYDEAGHRVATQYLLSVLNGAMPAERLLHYREFESGLPGHPEKLLTPGVEFSSGRLGHLPLEARRAEGRAVECFASQLVPTHGAPIVPSHVLHYFERPFEAFIL
jgi:Transketolase, thiamine diphosphate binding domain